MLSGHEESAVLIVGASEGLLAALEPAFVRHGIFAETTDIDGLVDAVVAAAPDLVVLCGEAASEGGRLALENLSASPLSSVTPVVILGDEVALDERLNAFRHGAAAVIPHTASVDLIADRIAQLAREIPERGGAALGEIGESTLEEFVQALGRELRSGILSVHPAGAEEEAVRLVLGAGRPLSDVIDEFVTRVRRHVVIAEPLRYEFDERAGGTVQLLGGADATRSAAQADVRDLRIVLADDDTARADAVSQELRAQGVTLVVTDLEPTDVRFGRLRQIDPAILLIGEKQAQGAGYELMRRMRRDTRLRWSSLLVVRWDEVWTESSPVPAVERILGTLAALGEPERAACERAASGGAFDTRLEIMGPARLLRAIGQSERSVRVSVVNPRVIVEVDLANGLVVGASGTTIGDGRKLEGLPAIGALLVLSSGRVHVEPVDNPVSANIMATLDVALNQADAEPPPIAPSLPIPATTVGASQPAPPAGPPPTFGQRLRQDLGGARKDLAQGKGPAGMPAFVLGGFILLQAVALAAGVLVLTGTQGTLLARPEPSPPSPSPRSTESPAPAPNTPLAARSAEQPVATAASKPEPAPAKLPPPQDPQPPAGPVESGLETAPTCDSLLGKQPAIAGSYPGAAYSELRLARKALVRGDLDETQRCYCRALRYESRLMDALIGMARLLLIRRDATAAAEYARKAAQIEPRNDDVQSVLGDALALSGESEAAKVALMAGAGIRAHDAPGAISLARRMVQLGHTSMRRRDHANAERFFRRAAVLDPGNWEGAYGVAHALLEAKRAPLSVSWARRAADFGPRQARTHVLLGDALLESGDAAGAEAAWRKALEVEPNDPEARFRVGRLGKP
jgi:Flp pilus assembly protein TadD/DNA-binding NarL/FixJ family response regulator